MESDQKYYKKYRGIENVYFHYSGREDLLSKVRTCDAVILFEQIDEMILCDTYDEKPTISQILHKDFKRVFLFRYNA